MDSLFIHQNVIFENSMINLYTLKFVKLLLGIILDIVKAGYIDFCKYLIKSVIVQYFSKLKKNKDLIFLDFVSQRLLNSIKFVAGIALQMPNFIISATFKRQKIHHFKLSKKLKSVVTKVFLILDLCFCLAF